MEVTSWRKQVTPCLRPHTTSRSKATSEGTTSTARPLTKNLPKTKVSRSTSLLTAWAARSPPACLSQQQTKGTVLLVCLRHKYGAHTVCRPKVTMFAVEMWFGVGDGVECGCSTGLYPLPLGVPRCVIHNKKKCWNEILVILKKK